MINYDPPLPRAWVTALIATPAITALLWLAFITPPTPGSGTPRVTPIASISPTEIAPR